MTPPPTLAELASELAKALRPFATMVGYAIHREQSDHDTLAFPVGRFRQAAEALAKYDSAQSAPGTRETPVQAVKALRDRQEQLDTDGVMVGVSRQALDEVLTFLQSAPERGGDEVYTQEDLDRADAKAAEIIAAIPVDDGWIEWKGGECPVSATLYDFRYRNGKELHGQFPPVLPLNAWEHTDSGADIIAYRPATGKGG